MNHNASETEAIKSYLNNQKATVEGYFYYAFHYTQYDQENDDVREKKITENYNQASEYDKGWILNWDEVQTIEKIALTVGKSIVGENVTTIDKNTLPKTYNLYTYSKLRTISETNRVKNIFGKKTWEKLDKNDQEEIYKIIGKRAIKDYLLKEYVETTYLGPGKDLTNDPTSGLSPKIIESLKYEAFYEAYNSSKIILNKEKYVNENYIKKYKTFTKVFKKEVDNYKIYTVGYGDILQTENLYSESITKQRDIIISTSDEKITGGIYKDDGANLIAKNYSIHIDQDAQGNNQIYLGKNISYGAKLDIQITKDGKSSKTIKDIAGIISDDNKIVEMREMTYIDTYYWGYIDFNKMCEKLDVSAANLNGAILSITSYNPNKDDRSLYYVLMKHTLPQNGGKYEPAVKNTTDGNVTVGSNYEDLTSVLVDIFKDVSKEEEVNIGDMLDEQLGIMINKGANVNIDIQFATEENHYNFDIPTVNENTEIYGYKIINQYNENLYINLNNLAKALGKNDALDFIGADMTITYR